MEILLASGNAHKLAELRLMLAGSGILVLTPDEVGGLPEVLETGATFEENAVLKACAAARHARRFALADDSGIVVAALGGAPGVRSARYAGQHGDDAANNRKLLDDLADVAPEQRAAAFVCVLALADPDGNLMRCFEGRVEGRILLAAEGQGGFGYDPLFQLCEPGQALDGRCFSTLSAQEKATVSHRGRALRAFARHAAQLMEV